MTLEDLISAATDDVNNEPIDEDVELDDVNLINIEHDTYTPNVSKDNEVVSEASSSTSNPSLQVTHNPTPPVNTKRKREYWSKSIKDAIEDELGDCIRTTGNLTFERGVAFLKRHNLENRGYSNLRHVINNMRREKKNNKT